MFSFSIATQAHFFFFYSSKINKIHVAQFVCCTKFFTWSLKGPLKLCFTTEKQDSAADISYCEPGHDLRSSLSFTAKQRSALPQEVPNKDREMETHRNRSLCSHDLIRHGGAGLSGSSAACCTDGRSKSNLWGDRERARITPLSHGAVLLWRHIDSGQRKSGVVFAIYCESLI